jgi:ABC-type transport system involved in multi-copper enzyme maturation permease subunit
MIRLTWRQFRIQAAIAIAGLVFVVIAALITGPQLVHLYNTTVATCKAQRDCQTATAAFLVKDDFLKNGFTALVFVVPALIGIFWGAPLIARELETGSFRLAWTQSVTRTRWLAVKLGVVGLSSVTVAGLLSLVVTWWFRPIDRVNANQFVATVFEARNLAPIGYAAFAFALAVTFGALIRRTVPAMAATLVGFVAARLVFTHWIRPHLLAPFHAALPLGSASDLGFQGDPSTGAATFIATNPHIPNAWTISSRIVDKAGRTPTTQALHTYLQRVCPGVGGPANSGGAGGTAATTFQGCMAHLSTTFHLAVTYQPASRYWTFQWLELAIFLVAAAVLTAICFWSLRRRLR